MHQRRTITAAVLFFFLLSGMAGLTYEILWMRMVVAVIGGAPFAVSIVLTIFMGGLGLGSYLASRRIDRVTQPGRTLRIYGLLELFIGGYALVLPLLIELMKPVWAGVYNGLFGHFFPYHLLAFLACALLFGLPVIGMGATLPVLVRYYVTALERIGGDVGRLYGLNTLGAAIGSFLCGFVMIQHLGMRGSLMTAVATNLFIGLFCLLLARRMPEPTDAVPVTECPISPEPRFVRMPPAAVSAALVLFAVSGFCSMGSEVIWTRMLGLLIGPTTYSFTIVLVTFIVGLALGSMLFGRLADRTGRAKDLLLATQVTAALLILGVSQQLGSSQLFFAKLIARYQENFVQMNVAKAGILFLFMILPTVCLGATFPLVGKIFTQSTARVGRSIGGAYAVNTIGAVLGSFTAGFLLVPWLGTQGAVSLLVALQLLGAIGYALSVGLVGQGRSRLSLAMVAVAVLGLAATVKYPAFDRLLLASGKYMRFEQLNIDLDTVGWLEALSDGPELLAAHETSELLFYADGLGGTVAVLEDRDLFGNTEYALTCSGKPDASSRGDMATQTLAAHVPMLLHPGAKSVMVLGLASGVTAGEVLLYPVDTLDVLEISRAVVEASRFFDPWNGNVLADSRTNLIIQDGRAHLMLTDKTYDVIASEPSNPWMAGLATLFTREFFTYARDRLRPGGIFVQFLHSYSMDWPTFALVGRTFADVFPHSALLTTSPGGPGSDYLLVGFKDGLSLDPQIIGRNLAYAGESRNVRVTRADQLFALVLAEDASAVFGPGEVNTDNRPRLEFTAPKLLYSTDPRIFSMLRSRRTISTTTQRLISQVRTNPESGLAYGQFALSLFKPFPRMVNLLAADEQHARVLDSLLCAYCRDYVVDMGLFQDGPELESCRSCQIERLRAVLDSTRDRELAYGYLVKLLVGAERFIEADSVAGQWVSWAPQSIEAKVNRGIVKGLLGDCREAATLFEAALALDSLNAIAHHNLGRARLDCFDYASAERHFRRALDIRPGFAEAHCYRGLALLQLNYPDSAITELTTALRLEPSLTAIARTGLDRATAMRRRP